MIKSFFKKHDARHLIYISLILVSLVCSASLHFGSIIRVVQSLRDLVTSLFYYFCSLMDLTAPFSDTINTYDFSLLSKYTNFDLDDVLRKLDLLLPGLFSAEYFLAYLAEVLIATYNLMYYLLLLLPAGLLFFLLAPRILCSESGKTGNSRTLNFYLQKIRPKLVSARGKISRFISFGKKKYRWILFCIWVVNLNVATIAVSALGYYFYLVGTFELAMLPIQLGKLLLDFIVMLSSAPVVFWAVIFYLIFDVIRKKIGYKVLNRHEGENRDVIDELPLNTLLCGYMESGKTTTMTDMTLSYESMLRDKALELMHGILLRFPKFPFSNVEKEIDEGIGNGSLKHLIDCADYIAEKESIFEKEKKPENVFGYDCDKYPMYNDNGLTIDSVWDVLRDYAQLYFIYTLSTSLIVSNIAIRTDMQRSSLGNFPLWQTDFFKQPSVRTVGTTSHVLDYDLFRMGKKLDRNNQKVGLFEFGVGVMSEKGKERGNALENQAYKKDDPLANPKNDLFNADLKLRRHPGTVSFYPFVKFFGDEQRPESVGADEREVSMIVHVSKAKETSMAMPFFTLTQVFSDWLVNKFLDFYDEYRYYRNDEGLFIYSLRHIVSFIQGYTVRRVNTFGYKRITLNLENGTQDGVLKPKVYYLSFKKIYSKRFSTDCYKNVFSEVTKKCKIGLKDLETYSDVCATEGELLRQNSYFVRDVFKNRK